VFAGDRLLTTPNVPEERDDDLLRRLGLGVLGRDEAVPAAPAALTDVPT
jgi:hypothetical protein